jgi:hypothetical protein
MSRHSHTVLCGLICVALSTNCPVGFAQKLYALDDVGLPASGQTVTNNGSKQPISKGGGGGNGHNWVLPALVIGVAAIIAVNHYLNDEHEQTDRNDTEGTKQLLRDGPQLPAKFNASAFGIRGLLRGGWPIVVDYEQAVPGAVQLRISIPGSDIVTYRLDKFGLGRHVLKFTLPAFLGDGLKPAVIALTAIEQQNQTETLDGFKVFGIGIGPRAVGSVAVDRLEFSPGTVSVGEGQTAGYGFHSKSTFDNAAVEFMHVTQSPDGIHTSYVKGTRIPGGVRQDTWVESEAAERWDGHDMENRVSEGRHQLQVRVWDDGGDWVGAWSDSLVTVH